MRSNGGSGESTSIQPPRNPSPKKAERPPLLKKFKTIPPDDHLRPTPHFPGPLFPAVRRVTSISPSSDRRTSENNSGSNVTSSSDLNDIGTNSFPDRDWLYPSFLGSHAARNQVVTVKTASKSPYQGGGERVVDEKQQTVSLNNKEEVKFTASRVSSSTVSESSPLSSSGARRIKG